MSEVLSVREELHAIAKAAYEDSPDRLIGESWTKVRWDQCEPGEPVLAVKIITEPRTTTFTMIDDEGELSLTVAESVFHLPEALDDPHSRYMLDVFKRYARFSEQPDPGLQDKSPKLGCVALTGQRLEMLVDSPAV